MSCIRKRAPSASSAVVRKVMQRNVGRTTSIECAFRDALVHSGLQFKVDHRIALDHRWKADFVFSSEKICVFVDGCFWHGCPLHFKLPHANARWWDEKIQANVARDHRQNEELTLRGWRVLRFWEH